MATQRQTQTAGKLDLNRASRAELMQIEGIGPATADDIVRYREKHGGFKSLDELQQVYGIAEGMFEKLREHFHV